MPKDIPLSRDARIVDENSPGLADIDTILTLTTSTVRMPRNIRSCWRESGAGGSPKRQLPALFPSPSRLSRVVIHPATMLVLKCSLRPSVMPIVDLSQALT